WASTGGLLKPSVALLTQRLPLRPRDFRSGVLGALIERFERAGALTRHSRIGSRKAIVKKKKHRGICAVQTWFTPAGFILMAHLVQFTFGGKRASARR